MKGKRMIMSYVTIVLSIGLLLVRGGIGTHPARAIEPKSAMADLKNLEPLKQLFQHDRGTVRLIALLSPV